jgi:hypothetical protein
MKVNDLDKAEELETEDTEIKETQKKSKKFWRYFWGTIIILLISYIALNITASKKLNEMSKQDREARLEVIVKDFEEQFPQFKTMTQELNSQSIKEIKYQIDISIDKVYKPLYRQIDNFSDFHYSVRGEYSELFTVVFGKVENILEEQLFKPTNFKNNLSEQIKNINNNSLKIITSQFKQIKQEVKDKLELNNDEINFLLVKILKLSQDDMKLRMTSYTNNIFKGMGLGGGAIAGTVMTKIMTKNIAKVIAKKIATKVAIKAGTKAAGVGASALAGAEAGVFCGPGAWLCSPVGAVVGGIVGWFATDVIVVTVDEYYNKDNFKEDIRYLINQQKNNTKATLCQIYIGSFNKIENDTITSFEQLKNTSIKDIISQ